MQHGHFPTTTAYPPPQAQYPAPYSQYPTVGYSTGRYGAYPTTGLDAPRQSGLGMISLVLGVLAGFLLFVTIVAAAGMARKDPNYFHDDNNPGVFGLGAFFIVGGCMTLVGLGMGIGGLTEPNRKKVLAALGVALNATIILGVLGLMAIGAMAR